MGVNAETGPNNLTERQFRGYWAATETSETNERIRFQAVLRLMEQETRLRLRPSKWEIAQLIGENETALAEARAGVLAAWADALEDLGGHDLEIVVLETDHKQIAASVAQHRRMLRSKVVARAAQLLQSEVLWADFLATMVPWRRERYSAVMIDMRGKTQAALAQIDGMDTGHRPLAV